MADSIRCISQHAESLVLSNGESEMVPAGSVSSGPVDFSDDNNKRLLKEGLILRLTKKQQSQTNNGGDDT